MRNKRGILVFGKPSLSRVQCETCNEETLHRYGQCIHCKSHIKQAVVIHPSWRTKLKKDSYGTLKRKRHAA